MNLTRCACSACVVHATAILAPAAGWAPGELVRAARPRTRAQSESALTEPEPRRREAAGPGHRNPRRTSRRDSPPSTGHLGKPQVRLPHVQSRDRPPDDHPLDLARALEDGEDPGYTGSLRRSVACGPHAISTDSARPVRDECRSRVGPCPVSVVVRTHADKVLERLLGCCYQPTPQRVHPRYSLALTCEYLAVHDTGPRAARTGRTRAGRPAPRAGRCHADTAASQTGRAASRQ
jgi:hypothetical protein